MGALGRLFDEQRPPVPDDDMMTFLATTLSVRGQDILATAWTPFRKYPDRDGIERCGQRAHVWLWAERTRPHDTDRSGGQQPNLCVLVAWCTE